MGAVKEALINNVPYYEDTNGQYELFDDDTTLSLADEEMDIVGDEMQESYVNELGKIVSKN